MSSLTDAIFQCMHCRNRNELQVDRPVLREVDNCMLKHKGYGLLVMGNPMGNGLRRSDMVADLLK